MLGIYAKPNLLIVDDDESIRNLLVIGAKSRGWRPVAAETWRASLQLLDSNIKAVVLDHDLPDGNGIQVLAQLRAKQPDVPVIMLTGLNDAETAVRALKAGADDYLIKPFDLERLFGTIGETCRTRKRHAGAHLIVDTASLPGTSAKMSWHSRSPRMNELFLHM